MRSFRESHILKIFEAYTLKKMPIDSLLRLYFRSNKSIGSKDRAFIADTTYAIIRWQSLIDYHVKNEKNYENRLDAFKMLNIKSALENPSIPLHVKASFPKWLFEYLASFMSLEKAYHFCLLSNEKAPTSVRANLLKTTRENLFNLWKDKYDVALGKNAPNAIIFKKKINLLGTEEFKHGLFEIQDEGSQLIADLMDVKPDDQVLDMCSGSGGKTLAFAPKMQNKGQIYLHDIRAYALTEAKKRLKRAGIQNAQIKAKQNLSYLTNKIDWLLLDVPCSGSGTLRRNPDIKWHFNQENLLSLIQEQRSIFDSSLKYLKKGGYLVYATCSILAQENEEQVEYFLKNHPVQLIKKVSWLPASDSMDGFFGAVFQKIFVRAK